MATKNIGQYNDGSGILPDWLVKISPSLFERFYSKPHEWFRQVFMEEGAFDGNTGSHLGNIIHATGELHAKGEILMTDEIIDYISQLDERQEDNPSTDICKQTILDSYEEMQYLIQQYIDEKKEVISATEGYLYNIMSKHTLIAGSFDMMYKNERGNYTMVDYKTTGLKLPPKYISTSHKYQAYLYAYMFNKIKDSSEPLVDEIEIVYITRFHEGTPPKISEKTGKLGKKGRDYPATLTSLKADFTQDTQSFTNDILMLLVETIEYMFEHPETTYLLFKDYRLKGIDTKDILLKYTGQEKYTDF